MFSGMSSSSSKSEDGTDEGLNKRATKVRSSPQINSVCFQRNNTVNMHQMVPTPPTVLLQYSMWTATVFTKFSLKSTTDFSEAFHSNNYIEILVLYKRMRKCIL